MTHLYEATETRVVPTSLSLSGVRNGTILGNMVGELMLRFLNNTRRLKCGGKSLSGNTTPTQTMSWLQQQWMGMSY